MDGDLTVENEIERRWVPNHIPDAIMREIKTGRIRTLLINQGYIPDENGSRLRNEIEQGVHRYYLTWKEGEGMIRPEHEMVLTQERFMSGWKHVTCQLWKTRYFIPFRNRMLQLNIYLGPLKGYMQIEVEFKTEEEAHAFVAPEWFGEEVTDDKRHGNHSLACYGIPDGEAA